MSKQVRIAPPFALSSPIADARWVLHLLSEESDWQVFLFLVTSNVIMERNGFATELRETLMRRRPFHIAPHNSMVETLKQLCVSETCNLRDAVSRYDGNDTNSRDQAKENIIGLNVQCVRDVMTLLVFVGEGKIIYRRKEVMNAVKRCYPTYLPFVRTAYRQKRERSRIRAAHGRRTVLGLGAPEEPSSITEKIVALWELIMSDLKTMIDSGNGLIPKRVGGDWREDNQEVYDEFASKFINSL